MDVRQNPFSVYDFLGYFTPGALFLYGVIGIYAHTAAPAAAWEFFSARLGLERAEIYIPFVLLAYTFGHILSFVSSVTIERYSIWSSGYPSKYLLGIRHEGYFEISENKALRASVRVLVWLVLWPVTTIDALVGSALGFRALYAKKLDPLLIEIVLKKMCALLIYHGDMKDPPANGDAAKHDFFRYVYHYSVEHAPHHLPKMQNYVALYGFLRTLTLLSILISWGLVAHLFSGTLTVCAGLPMILGAALFSFTLYMAFVKFYRRFSLEALMALVSIYEVPSDGTDAEKDGTDDSAQTSRSRPPSVTLYD